jgi:hypothetical protein
MGRGKEEAEEEATGTREAVEGILGLDRLRKEEEGEEERFKELDLTRLGAEGEVGRTPREEERAPVE